LKGSIQRMADMAEKIKGFLKEIKMNQMRLRVQISVVLKKLEEYLFETKLDLDEDHIKLILLGNYEHDEQGLIRLCGTRGRGAKRFKNSAFSALKLLLRLLEEHYQKEDFIVFVRDLEDDEFPMLRLGEHLQISDPEKNEETPYRICKIIYERRSFLDLDVYIKGRDNQIKFAKWYEETKKNTKAQDHDEPETWEREAAKGPDLEEEAAKKFESLTKKRKQNVTEFDELNFDRDHEFFMKTFQDPMISKQKAEEYSFALQLKGKKKKGKKDVNIPYIADRDTAEFRNIIEELHIDSEKFDPFVLLETFHSKTPYDLMVQAIDKVAEDIENQKEYKENLMIFYVNEFAKCERILGRIQETFLIPESNPAKGMTTDIISKIEEINKELAKVGGLILVPKRQADEVRTCLLVYEKMKHIIIWPKEIKECLIKKNLGPIIKNYPSYTACLSQYRILPIFREVFEEIQKLAHEVQKQILSLITINEKNGFVIIEAIRNLYITAYSSEPVDTALQRLFDEIGGFISNYFSTSEVIPNRKSRDFHSIRDEEVHSYYKSSGDLHEDADGLTEYLDNYVEFKEEKKAKMKKFYFQKKNLENFVQDFLDSIDLFYAILAALKEGKFREFMDQKYEDKAIEQYERCVNDIWNLLLKNIQSYVDENAKRAGARKAKQNDLLSLGKSLAKVDKYLMEKNIKRQEFRDLKLKTIELFLEEIQNSFTKEELMKIKYWEKSYLKQDFEGNSYSEFMDDVKAALEKNIRMIQKLSIFQAFEPAKGEKLANYFASIFINLIKILRNKILGKTPVIQGGNQIPDNSINILVVLTNMNFIAEFYFLQIAKKYCSDLNIYDEDDFNRHVLEKLRPFLQRHITELKALYVDSNLNSFQQILKEYLTSEFVDQKKGSYSLEAKFAETFKQFVLSEKEFPQIRVYVFDILMQLVTAFDELMNYAAFTKDELLRMIVQKSCKAFVDAVKIVSGQSKNIDELKQLWCEIEFFQNVASKFQTEDCKIHFKRIYQSIVQTKAAIEKVYVNDVEMFTVGELVAKKRLILKTRFEFQKQFEVLFM